MPILNTTNHWMRATINEYDCYIYETGPISGYCVMQKQTGKQCGKWVAYLIAGPIAGDNLPCLHDGESWCYYDSAEAAKAAVMDLHAIAPVDSLTIEMRSDGLMQQLT